MATFQRLKAQPRNAMAIGLLSILVYFGLTSGHLPLSPTANADDQRMVSLYVDGQKKIFATDATTVSEVLKRSGVTLRTSDLVEPAASTAIPEGLFNVNVYRARPVLVVDGAHDFRVTSAYQSPRLLAQAAGLTVYPEDTYQTEVITDFVDDGTVGEKVVIDRATPLTIKADGKVLALRTHAKTVKQALIDSKVALGAEDTANVELTDPVVAGLSINITRVSDVELTISDVLPHATQTVNDPTLLKGQTKVQTEGSNGEKNAIYRIHYRDGHETSRELIKLINQIKPVTRVEVIGTKVLFAGSVEYWRPMVEAAAAEWQLDPNMMLRIMACESRGNALSVSQFIINGQHPTGLYQYLASTWRSAGGTDDNILDGAMQIKLTARKMAREGTKAWQCK
jgi:uncharacterized protein YabE (DUF348 family)